MTGPAETVPGPEAEGPRRADAVRNREKVIAAAEAVFAEHGLEAGIPEVAHRAGVGKGTIYRNFETKDDLIAAILVRRMNRFDEEVVAALEREDPGEAFREVLLAAAARASALSFPAALYRTGSSEELDRAYDRLARHMATLVGRAKRDGSIRPDATVEEVWRIFGAVCRSLADAGEKDPGVWRRHATLVADAFRPPGNSQPG